jgi:3D (Asp-Asp-Asp) domain-containing protein
MIESFDYYDTLERIKTCLADAESRKRINCRRLTREERRARRYRRTYIAAVLIWAMFMIVLLTVKAISAEKEIPATAQEITATEAVESEDFENAKIETALLERANVIENCTVTWYTADTCGKKPSDPAYGITYSGLPVVEHLTCAVDKNVIPLYADVFVQYADGTIEQLWATDTGVKGNHIDIYTPDYDYAIQCGRQSLTVWYIPQVEAAP